MQKLFNPKWIFLVNTLPIVVLFILFSGQFSIIKTLLNEEAIKYWKIFGTSLGVLGILNFAYAVYLTVKKQNVSMVYGIIALICHIAFIYLCLLNEGNIITFNIPRWMISVNLYLYVISFLMPTLAYSLFILIAHFTPETKKHKAIHNFLISISIPVGCYLLSQISFSFHSDFIWSIIANIHTFFVLFSVLTLVFFFFLVRTIFIIIAEKTAVWEKYQLVLKSLIVIAFLFGLLIFAGIFIGGMWSWSFGEFLNPWFYILAIFNGILICLPNLENKFYRLSLFALRSVTFSYTFYFFMVFLPFSPLAVIAIIFIGLGFLLLAPLLLFIIHIAEISKDFGYLRTWFSKKSLIAILALCFLVIPTCVTATYLKDKSILNEALAYLYAPDYSKQYNIDKKSLKKTLRVINYHQIYSGRGGDFFSNGIPYLTSYFNWIVLDNHSISRTKSDYIKQVFFGPDSSKSETEFDIRNSRVEITGISASGTYDESQNAWKTWVNLEITNKSDNFIQEYSTTIDLPEGCWISDYYLDVEGRKEYGILSEKKTAMWVYSNIRNVRRDPGILHYLTGNKVAFKVFPFSRQETRKTGIEFLHKEPLKLTIDSNIIELGNEEKPLNTSIETENFAYISAEQKQKLIAALRKPYFHFLVDASKGKEKDSTEFAKRIENFLENKHIMSENAQISFVNTYVDSPKRTYEGGFYLERAIKTVLFNAYKNKSYPIIVVVTDDIQNAILEKDFSDFKFAFPESDLFFELDYNGDNVFTHSLSNNPIKRLSYGLPSFEQTVLEYKFADNSVAYLPNNNEPSIVLKNEIFEIAEKEIEEKNWQSALAMQAMRMSHILHPERAAKEWQKLVKYSFLSKIMTPETSYLVVENEAQKAILRSKQKEVLSSNKFLDLDEDTTQRMSEPNIWILMVLFGLILWGLRRHLWRQ
ncbi:MAG: MSEP-CTERM sorting domain-containing protein [Fibromonadaceae bacterium]|jgi:hypothetical protein|nr:MSEP-CTERM sorting domain-containing protein [Fibromonadaceae bacterium]